MAESDLSPFQSKAALEQALPGQIPLLTVFQLGLFNLGLGVMSVLTVAVLNRVMISELAIPGTITAGTVAMQYFVAPARVWFGQLSDTKPLFGLHRTGYVRLGTLIFGLAVFLAVQVVWLLGAAVRANGGWVWNEQTLLWTAVLIIIFLCYGLAISSSSTPFTALLVDVSEEDNRSKIVAVVWSMLMVGIVVGAISGGIFLKKIQQTGTILGANIGGSLLTGKDLFQTPLAVLKGPLNSLFLIVPIVVLILAFVGTWGVEKKYSFFAKRSEAVGREDSMGIRQAIKILTASRQTAIFFSFLLTFTVSLFLQEAVLEPYGGEVFGMSIAQTTQINGVWGVGILVGYSTTGFLIIPRLGKMLTAKMGCLLVALCFVAIILSGFTQNQQIFQGAIFVFGVAAGVATISAISLMLDLTVAETAGTFIGAWGLAQALARALAILGGGVILDIGKALFTAPLLSYSLVFGIQAFGMIGAVLILDRVNVQEFKESTKTAIATVMVGDLD